MWRAFLRLGVKRPRRTCGKIIVMIVLVVCSSIELYTQYCIHTGLYANNIKNRIQVNKALSLHSLLEMYGRVDHNQKGVISITNQQKPAIIEQKTPHHRPGLVDIPHLTSARTLIAMPTHDRIGYVQLTLLALRKTFYDGDLHIFDDMSIEYGYKEIQEWAPNAKIHPGLISKLGPDANTRRIMQFFLNEPTKYDVLIILDSDMLVAPGWWQMYKDGLNAAPGVLSLYRSGAPKHYSIDCNSIVCREPSMGNAGSVWRRSIAEKFMHDMPDRIGGFDWGWSEWCTKNNIPMHALKMSALLHIGMHGTWSRETTQEKSVGFPMETLELNIRTPAERFLKGGKPTAWMKKSTETVESREKDTDSHLRQRTIWIISSEKRAWTLDLVLKSLVKAKLLGEKNVIVSIDRDSPEITFLLERYKNLEIISHPFSCARNPNSFPGNDPSLNINYKGDTYGNPRSLTATCWKHHWWWLMHEAWKKSPERVCFLEDDIIVHPQAREWLSQTFTGHVKLTKNPIAVPWCMTRKEWNMIDKNEFCTHDDYNWDQTIAWMMEKSQAGPNKAIVPDPALSMHIGDCDGWDSGGRRRPCDDGEISKIRLRAYSWLNQSFTITTKTSKWLPAHTRPNGGWGHPRDHKHCLEVAGMQKNETELKIAAILHIRIYEADKAKITRNELKEWHDFMRFAGVDHFYVYEGAQTTAETVDQMYDDMKDVTYHKWQVTIPDKDKVNAYQHAADNYKHYEWHIAFDVDEIPFSTRDTTPGFLKRILKKYVTQNPTVSEFSFNNYLMLGIHTSDNHYYERYVRRTIFPANNLVKPIYKPACIKAQLHHNALKCGTHKSFVDTDLRMNHYWGGRLQGFVGNLSLKWNGKTQDDRSIYTILNQIYTNKRGIQYLEVAGESLKYAIVVPSVYRNNNTYLKICLESLHKTKPANVPVFLVNGNNPPEKHTFLLEWCKTHPAYQCITPDKIPTEYFSEVIKKDKRGDKEIYLKWRSTETEHAIFGLKAAMNKNTERIIFLQDDTFIHANLFTEIDLHQQDEVICLYKSHYCGMVGYALTRNFVQYFLNKVDADKSTMPIDWILDKSITSYGTKKAHLDLINHLKKISSRTVFQENITSSQHTSNPPERKKKCGLITFLSGGKCGSTTLAILMKHKYPDYNIYDPASVFLDAGKELCGALPECDKNKHYILDACPTRLSQSRAKASLKMDPDAVGVLLVRNQPDALLSLFRDRASLGGASSDANDWASKNIRHSAYDFYGILMDARAWGFKNIVVVHNHELQSDAAVAQVLKRIFFAAGLPPPTPSKAILTNNAGGGEGSRYRPGKLSSAMRVTIENEWKEKNNLFFKETGVRIQQNSSVLLQTWSNGYARLPHDK